MIDVKIIKKPKTSGGSGGSSGGSSGGGTVSKAAKADKAKTAEQADYATRAGVATRALYCDNAAGISAATAKVDDMTGKPSVTVSITDWDEVEQRAGAEDGMTGRTLDFVFSGLKGEPGTTEVATTSENGLMSSTDKKKLDDLKLKFWTGTQTAYNSLSKDANTLYIITE